MTTLYNQITQRQLREQIEYCPLTGDFTWKSRRTKKHLVGQPAGFLIKSNGYLYICIEGHSYPAHRLVWLYVHGRWPTHQIDHKNRNKIDNSLDNLREATHGQNQVNRTLPSQSGCTGVYCNSRLVKRPWRASIYVRGKMKNIGHFASCEAAAAAFHRAALDLHGEFYSA